MFAPATFWSLVPAIVAIVLALITKEVYSSLFIGIIIGAFFFSGASFSGFLTQTFEKGFIKQLSSSWNVGIIIFLVILGTMVALMNRAGGSQAFGEWAKKHIKSKVGAQISTICLGILIFIDDYFNCLTVGSVMKPVTEKYKVSGEKLAYLIDATAAPVCIIAPISSWTAAVSGFAGQDENGLALFCRAIPFNFYALFTLVMIFSLVLMKFDFGSMARFEAACSRITGEVQEKKQAEAKKGRVIDLVFPIIALIVFCTLGMIYSGGFFTPLAEDGSPNATYMDFIESFASSDASVGLVLGSFAALIVTVLFYVIRRVLSFRVSMSCLPDGFKAMVPAILILTLAWTLKGMTDDLKAGDFVSELVEKRASGLQMFLPAIIFVIGCFLAFATGTSWGTFGILIPICISVFPEGNPLRIISISACMAGAVCGDHISPISDTTIMASAGAGCNHVNHVSTQLPYALFVAVISFLSYVIAGVTSSMGTFVSCILSLVFGVVLLEALLLLFRRFLNKKNVIQS